MDNGQLAQTLVQSFGLTAADVDSALQRQVVLGGSLDTNLLEAELLSESELLQAMGQAYALPMAGKAEIDNIGSHLPRLFPLVFAETYHLVPMRLVDQDLSVLSGGPPDAQLVERIRERLGLHLLPQVTSEVRLHYAMHRLYGSELLPRFTSLLARLDGHALPAATGGEGMLSWGVSSARIAPVGRGGSKLRGQDVRTLVAKLDAATDRDSMVEILLGFALAVFEYAALFVVQGEHVNGWRSTDAETTRRIAGISLPLGEPSAFRAVQETMAAHLGPLPSSATTGALLTALGRAEPRVALLAPIKVGGRLAAVLYADNGAHAVAPKRVAALLVIVQRTALALEVLIRRRKGAATPRHEAEAPIGVALPRSPPPKQASLASLDLDMDPSPEEVANDRLPEPMADEVYVAFADVNEGAQESLDEWEDVLVDTVGEATRAAQEQTSDSTAPLSVTWEDVALEAKAAARLVPQASRTVEVLGTRLEERDIWFDGLDADTPETRRTAVSKLLPLGSSVDAELAQRFPGRILFDPLEQGVRPPPFEACSGLTELLAARGTDAAPVVLPQLESDDPVRRFFAIYFLLTVHYAPGVEALARRLYDTEPRNRHLAIEALRHYRNEPAYARMVQGLREQLKTPVPESQSAAIQILGQLREPSVVPALIPLLSTNQAHIARTAASALAVICAQAFGTDLESWQMWWQHNYNKPRASWLVSGLNHNNVIIRRVANVELQQLSGQTVPFDPEASLEERDSGMRAWQGWLSSALSSGSLPT